MAMEIKLTAGQKKVSDSDLSFIVPVFKTSDYNKFMFIESNRIIKPGKVSKLKNEIERNNLLIENEIKVIVSPSGKLIIYDGQHRFAACMELGLPIYYRFSKMAIEDIGIFNSMPDKWSLEDSLHSYCMRDAHDYKVLAGFRKTYQYPLSTLIGILQGRHDKTMLDEFRMGDFKVTQELEFVHEVLSKIQEFKKYNDKIYRHRTFLRVYMDLLTHPKFNHDTMIHKIEQIPIRFIFCTRVNDYLRMIEDIYNYNNRNPIKLY